MLQNHIKHYLCQKTIHTFKLSYVTLCKQLPHIYKPKFTSISDGIFLTSNSTLSTYQCASSGLVSGKRARNFNRENLCPYGQHRHYNTLTGITKNCFKVPQSSNEFKVFKRLKQKAGFLKNKSKLQANKVKDSEDDEDEDLSDESDYSSDSDEDSDEDSSSDSDEDLSEEDDDDEIDETFEDFSGDAKLPTDYEEFKIRLNKPRCDAVLRKALNMSGSEVEKFIVAEKVFINGTKIKKRSSLVKEKDFVDLVYQKSKDVKKFKRVRILKIIKDKDIKDKNSVICRAWKEPVISND